MINFYFFIFSLKLHSEVPHKASRMEFKKSKLNLIHRRSKRKTTTMSTVKHTKDGFEKWKRDCEAAKYLEAGIRNQDIDPNTKPKDLWMSNSVFRNHKLETFRSGYNKIKTQLGCHVRTGKLSCRCRSNILFFY